MFQALFLVLFLTTRLLVGALDPMSKAGGGTDPNGATVLTTTGDAGGGTDPNGAK